MPSPLRTVPLSPVQPGAPGDAANAASGLAALRAELDRLDDALHDTLMRRAEVVGGIAALGVKGAVPLRPGREASIVRRLLARHIGCFPAAGVVRIWRELICACTALQRPLLIAVCEAGGDPAYIAAAREHFGALVPLRACATPAQAVREVGSGAATAAVLPLPAGGEAPHAAWWTALLPGGDAGGAGGGATAPRVHVVARLPFWGSPRPEGTPGAEALVVSAAPPDPSGADRSLLGLELPAGSGREWLAGALAAAGFAAGPVVLQADPGGTTRALVDVEGFVAEGDPRLAAFAGAARPLAVLGAYAVPLIAPAGSAPTDRPKAAPVPASGDTP